MARLREPRSGDIPKGYLRKRATGAEKVNYNENKLAKKAFTAPKPVAAKKRGPKPKKTATKKKGKKINATYLTLVLRALKKLQPKADRSGVSIPEIVKYLYKNYPEKSDRRYVKLALAKGVDKKSLVKRRLKYRLSAREEKKAAKKKTTKKSTGTKRKASTKDGEKGTKKAKTAKKATKKTTTKKSTTKKAATKKAGAKKTTKKAAPTKRATTKKAAPKKTKKVADTDSVEESRGSIAEGEGNPTWQYYDNGWFNYAANASTIVEGVFQEYKSNPNIDVRAVQSGHFSYTVDFTNLRQQNTQTGTSRNIRRILA